MQRIPNFTAYSVTEDGRVYSHRRRPGFIVPAKDKNGYERFHLEDDTGKRRGIYVHQAVAQANIPNPDKKPEVNHLDHDKSNNHVSNLRWCTHQENIQHDWAKGKRSATYGNRKITAKAVKEIRRLYDLGYTQVYLAAKFGIIQPTISQIVRNVTWRNI